MDSLELIINLSIIILLIPTIIYAYKLNKNLSLLRQNQKSLSQLISSLNEATNKAENSIPKLKSVTEHSSEDLKEVIDSAKNLKDDLTFINERADNLGRPSGKRYPRRPGNQNRKFFCPANSKIFTARRSRRFAFSRRNGIIKSPALY